MIEGPRLIPVNPKPLDNGVTIRKPFIMTAPPPTPAYVRDLYVDYFEQTGDKRPLEEYDGSWITGGTFEGAATALGELAVSNITPKEDPNVIIKAAIIYRIFKDGLPLPSLLDLHFLNLNYLLYNVTNRKLEVFTLLVNQKKRFVWKDWNMYLSSIMEEPRKGPRECSP